MAVKGKGCSAGSFFRQESNAYKCRCESGFPGAGLENRKKNVGNNMNKVTEIYQESCFKVARKNLYETTFFSTDTFYFLIKSNIAGKKFSTKQLFSLRNIFSETFSVYWKLLLETLFRHVNNYFNISKVFCARLYAHMCTMEINACMQ